MRPGLWGPSCLFRMWLAELPEIRAANNGAVWLSLSPGQRKWVAFAPVIRCFLGYPLIGWPRWGPRGEVPTKRLSPPPLASSFRTKQIPKRLRGGIWKGTHKVWEMGLC